MSNPAILALGASDAPARPADARTNDAGTSSCFTERPPSRRWPGTGGGRTRGFYAVHARALDVEDQAREALVREVGPGPVGHDREPVAEADQEEDVDHQPGEPGQEPRHVEAP